jgi:uncharacterized FlaG/YvyC family protein
MEITPTQSKPVTLAGVTPAKVSVVVGVKSNASPVATPSDLQNTILGKHDDKEIVESTDKVERQDDSQNQAENLHVAVSQMNDHVQNLQRDLIFTVDSVTGKDVVTVIDRHSEEIIRQIPSEEALVLARRLAENRDDRLRLFSTLV